ncbi:MAG: hypothetical protein LBB58_02850 [Cellulomonadaceae bacterium]|jgi:glycosyltransferase involved in cell wall biosynthesis|nr:hypothetical protein [Cellulomonadaceae bacterium]
MSNVKILPFPFRGRKIKELRSLYFAAQTAGWELVKDAQSVDHLLVHMGVLSSGDILHIIGLRPFGYAMAEEPGVFGAISVALTHAKEAGIKIVWTLHHVLTPDSEFPEQDLAIHQVLADFADVIVVPHSETLRAIGGLYNIDPEKLFLIPSASYLGLYTDDETDAAVREVVAIPAENRVIGLINNYGTLSEITTFVNALKLLEESHPNYQGLVRCDFTQGEVDEEAEIADAPSETLGAAEELVTAIPTAIVRFGQLPRHRMAAWYRACDLVVFPEYRDMDPYPLLMAATFGRRVLIPAGSTLARVFAGEEWVATFEPAGPGEDESAALAAGIASTLGGDSGFDRAAWRFARQQTPFAMSRAYAKLFAQLAAQANGSADSVGSSAVSVGGSVAPLGGSAADSILQEPNEIAVGV